MTTAQSVSKTEREAAMTSAMTSAMKSRAMARFEAPHPQLAVRSLVSRRRHRQFLTYGLAKAAMLIGGAGMVAPQASARDFCISCTQPDAVYSCQVETGYTLPAEAAAKLHCIKELARRGAHSSCSVSRHNDDVTCAGEAVVLAPPSAIPAGPGNGSAALPAAIPPNALPSGRPSEVIDSQGVQDYRYAPPQPGPQSQDARAKIDDRQNGENAGQQLDRALTQDAEVQPDQKTVQEQSGKRSNKPPKTVEELAKRAAEDSQKGLKQAGELVADTAKSTGKTIENTGKAVGNAAKKTWDCVSSFFSKC